MSSEANEQHILGLKAARDKAQQDYYRVVADLRHRKEQLDTKTSQLRDLGCDDLAQAQEVISDLQSQIDEKIGRIRELL